MILIKDLQDFENWKKARLMDAAPPARYPCFLYEVVTDWGMEETAPQFLYAENLKGMFEEVLRQAKARLRNELIQEIAGIVGEGIHTCLRENCSSLQSDAAWKAISEMPDYEWNGVCITVAEELIEVIVLAAKKERMETL